jgi:hypothetical protein
MKSELKVRQDLLAQYIKIKGSYQSIATMKALSNHLMSHIKSFLTGMDVKKVHFLGLFLELYASIDEVDEGYDLISSQLSDYKLETFDTLHLYHMMIILIQAIKLVQRYADEYNHKLKSSARSNRFIPPNLDDILQQPISFWKIIYFLTNCERFQLTPLKRKQCHRMFHTLRLQFRKFKKLLRSGELSDLYLFYAGYLLGRRKKHQVGSYWWHWGEGGDMVSSRCSGVSIN